MKEVLQSLNRVPGVLGSVYFSGEVATADCGEAIGCDAAVPLARRAVDAFRRWVAEADAATESAIFIGERGRMLVRVAGAGYLVAFAENDAAAGILKMRMRDAAAAVR